MADRMPVFVQFVPLSLFAAYAFWAGPAPSRERWMSAFMVGGAAALLHLLLVLRQPTPVNRLLLGANLYLLVGAAAAVTRLWPLLLVYAELKEAGIFVWMLLVGIVTTAASPAGYVGRLHANDRRVRAFSLALLGLTALALAMSVAFRGNATWAAVVPVTALALANQILAHRLDPPTRGVAPAS